MSADTPETTPAPPPPAAPAVPVAGRARSGLTGTEVVRLREAHGWNELPGAAAPSRLRVFLRQFSSLLVLILIVAAGIAAAIGESIDAAAILLVVLLNAALGYIQEWRAETALDALRAILAPVALVVRDGAERRIPAREIVPGDVVIVDAGDRVPADLELTASVELRIDESALTGESVPVSKSPGDRLSAATTVVSGRGEGRTVAIGASTDVGRIAELTGEAGEKTTHLQRQLAVLARQLGLAAIAIAIGIAAIGLTVGRSLADMALTGLSLAVAVVPEGLPAVVTVTLALGAAAMARQKALARRLQAVETVGAATVICTDKTGTLTENRMTATRVRLPDRWLTVTGTGLDPTGHIADDDTRLRAADDPRLGRLLRVASHCTSARLSHADGVWSATGTPTETALLVLALKGWAPHREDAEMIAERPFASDRKLMSVLVNTAEGPFLLTKGAPEQVLSRATRLALPGGDASLNPAEALAIRADYERMAAEGLRVIACAERPAPGGSLAEEDLTFLGLVGLIDPPRPEVREAIEGARAAGVRTVMITGDSPVTAAAIGRALGLPDRPPLTGAELDELGPEGLAGRLSDGAIFARTRPEQKMQIVKALQAAGEIVAMTGDGVNDAPALKQADIGVAMGQRGTDVARDAADLVLLDDNYATIVRAIREGRRQYDNVRKFVRYLLASNAGEVIAILASLLLGGPVIFLATQILWMNLVTDGVTAVALGLEPSEKGQMRQPPRSRGERIVGPRALWTILAFGTYTGLATLWLFQSLLPLGEDIARTAAFTAMVVFEKVSVFAFRSLRTSCFTIGWFSNPLLLGALGVTLLAQIAAVYAPPMQVLLHTAPLSAQQWGTIAALALPLLVVPDAVKAILSRRERA